MTLARARKAQRQPTSNLPKGEGLRRKPNGPANLRDLFLRQQKRRTIYTAPQQKEKIKTAFSISTRSRQEGGMYQVIRK
jgi:hypothetical protein